MEQHQRSVTCAPADWDRFMQICMKEGGVAADKLGDFVRATVDGVSLEPKPLSQTVRQRIETASRKLERQLLAEHATRMAQLDEEVRQRVLRESKEHLAYLNTERAEARKTEALYRELIAYKAPLTPDEYTILRKVIHPDNSASTETRNQAFRILMEKKDRLVQP